MSETGETVRFDLHAALDALKGCGRILVCPHDDPDPDALAAALGMSELLGHCLGIETTLAFEGLVGRAENRAMVRTLHVHHRPTSSLAPATFDGAFLVDTQPDAGNHSVPDALPVLGCVDHHPALDDGLRLPWLDVRPEAGSTATLVHNYLVDLDVPIDARLATAMVYALRTDTRYFSRGATDNDLAMYTRLVSTVDHTLLGAILHPRLDPEYFELLHRALESARVHGEATTAYLEELPYPDLVAETADLLVRRRGTWWCLCAGTFDGQLRFSLRAERPDSHAGALARTLARPRGGSAGGHGLMAGGRVPLGSGTAAAAGRKLWPELEERFLRAIDATIEGTPLW